MQVETATPQNRLHRHVEAGWLSVADAMLYTGQSEYEIRAAIEIDPLSGKPALEHVRIGRKGKISFTRQMLDRWMLRGLRPASDDEPDMRKG